MAGYTRLKWTCDLIFLIFEILNCHIHAGSVLESINHYEIIHPVHLNKHRSRRDLSTRQDAGHLTRTSFLIKTKGGDFQVELFLNRGVISPNFAESYQRDDGSEYVDKNPENCFYHGSIAGKAGSFVAFSTCEGLSGIIHDEDGQKYGIQPFVEGSAGHAPDGNRHIFFNLKDVKIKNSVCGVNETSHHHPDFFGGSHVHSVARRSTGSKKEQKYISVVMVVDKRMYDKFGKNSTKTSLRAKEIANYVDGVFKTMGVRVALVMVETWNLFDLIHVTESAGDTLSEFQKYTFDVLSKKNYKQDNAQLLTAIDFSGSVVGMAGIGTICGLKSAGVNQDHSSLPALTANTVAHEMGHNLGMHHDGTSCTCTNSPCVMTAVASSSPVKGFSSCSVEMLNRKIKDGVASCLFDTPTKLFGDPVCGNDFLEEGEECDCGTEEECKASGGDKCCHAKTCKLHSNAKCAVGACCENCQFKRKGTLCRDKLTECDLEEYCTGNSHLCPGNFYKQDGLPCKGNQAYCFEGGCRTHDEQCEILWGSGAKIAADICFDKLNPKGNEFGNCGKNRRDEFIKCLRGNVKCGKLQCQGMTKRLPIIGTDKRVSDVVYYIGTQTYQCRVASVSLGKDLEDPTIVGQGTKCDEGKVCYNYTCTNVTTLPFIKKCPFDCGNGGFCNNKGHCHCKVGYACPDCVHSGPGGSIDSGQGCYDAKSGGLSAVAKAMLVLFLLVIPLLALAAFLAYKYKEKIRARFRRKIEIPKGSRFSKLPPSKGADGTPVVPPAKSHSPTGDTTDPEVAFIIPNPSGPVTPSTVKANPSKPPWAREQRPAPHPHRAPPPAPVAKPGLPKRVSGPSSDSTPNYPAPKPSPFGVPTRMAPTAPSKPTKPPKVLPPVKPPYRGRPPNIPPKP